MTTITDKLEEALRDLRSVCFDRRNALFEFERLGELYYQEFGRLRPGKDDPGRDSNDPENVAQYEAWSKARTEAAFDLAERALSTPAEPRTVEPLTVAEIDALRRDAERYRAIRDDDCDPYGICIWDEDGGWAQDARKPDVVDAAIDAALAAARGETR